MGARRRNPDSAQCRECEVNVLTAQAVPVGSHFSEPIEPWNGDEFEGVEIEQFEFPPKWAGATPETCKVKHKVCFYWTGDRYAVEDMEPFIQVEDKGEWRDTTRSERDLFMTGIERKHWSRDEMEATREEWVDRVWASMKAHQDEREEPNMGNLFKPEPSLREQYPDGVPRSNADAAFDRQVNGIDEEAAAYEQREVARRKMAFMRRLRRR